MQKEKNKVSSRFKNLRISNGFAFEMGRKKRYAFALRLSRIYEFCYFLSIRQNFNKLVCANQHYDLP